MEIVKEYFILGKFCVRKKARIFIHNEMRTEEAVLELWFSTNYLKNFVNASFFFRKRFSRRDCTTYVEREASRLQLIFNFQPFLH